MSNRTTDQLKWEQCPVSNLPWMRQGSPVGPARDTAHCTALGHQHSEQVTHCCRAILALLGSNAETLVVTPSQQRRLQKQHDSGPSGAQGFYQYEQHFHTIPSITYG